MCHLRGDHLSALLHLRFDEGVAPPIHLARAGIALSSGWHAIDSGERSAAHLDNTWALLTGGDSCWVRKRKLFASDTERGSPGFCRELLF
jgi:hypothetical protein